MKQALSIRAVFKLLRVHQYAKNLLLIFPLLLAHEFTNTLAWVNCFLGFVSFSLLASCVYIINDRLDIESDRQHRTKKNRPLASGAISFQMAYVLLALCFAGAVLIALSLPIYFQITLLSYFILTLCYSLYLKRLLLVDVILLSLLYTVRIIAGGAVAGVLVSEWLLLFSFFIFTSLALLKRYTELYFAQQENTVGLIKGRGYKVTQISLIQMFGVASGFLSILVLALYIHSEKALLLYRFHEVLYLACPLLLYWIARVWLLASEGMVHEDPIVYALKDKASYAVVLAMFALGIIASSTF